MNWVRYNNIVIVILFIFFHFLIVQLADGIAMSNEDRTYSYAFSKQKLRISAIVAKAANKSSASTKSETTETQQ